MKIPYTFSQQVSSELSSRAITIAFLYAFPILPIVKYISPLLYGSVASAAAVSKAIMILSPVMAIGVAMLAIQAPSLGWKQIIIRSIGGCLIVSSGVIAIIPTAIS
ncbi:MAG TPA: hypothetical protein VGM92_02735 [Candidatus Kapabacteria bacterium]